MLKSALGMNIKSSRMFLLGIEDSQKLLVVPIHDVVVVFRCFMHRSLDGVSVIAYHKSVFWTLVETFHLLYVY